MDEQAGDPFAKNIQPNATAADRDGIVVPEEKVVEKESDADRMAAVQALQDGQRPRTPEMDEATKVLDDFETLQAELAEEENAAKGLTLDEVRAIVKETAKAVEDADFNLDRAKRAYQIASLLAVEFSVKPTLVELNNSQLKVTAKEVRHRNRAMKALGELGYGNPKQKPHPQLFR